MSLRTDDALVDRNVAWPQHLDDHALGTYWSRVARTLTSVFGMTPIEAGRVSDMCRRRLTDHGSRETQLHFYHLDPLHVAADLAGAAGRPITPEELAAYLHTLDLQEDARPNDAMLRHS